MRADRSLWKPETVADLQVSDVTLRVPIEISDTVATRRSRVLQKDSGEIIIDPQVHILVYYIYSTYPRGLGSELESICELQGSLQRNTSPMESLPAASTRGSGRLMCTRTVRAAHAHVHSRSGVSFSSSRSRFTRVTIGTSSFTGRCSLTRRYSVDYEVSLPGGACEMPCW